MLDLPQYVLFLSYANIYQFSSPMVYMSYLTMYRFFSTGKLSWTSTL